MRHLVLDPREYPGGIAIWGGVPPIFETAKRTHDEGGIHVHARKVHRARKDIDESYDQVIFFHSDTGREIRIDQEAAVAFMMSQILGVKMRHVVCEHCGDDLFGGRQEAHNPVRQHVCGSCTNTTETEDAVVANPLISLRKSYSTDISPAVIPAPRSLAISWDEAPGGLDVWGSNQAIVWTASSPEEEGLHVHLYSNDGAILSDDTYSDVTIGRHSLAVQPARLWMAQREIIEIRDATDSITCDKCHRPLCSLGIDARRPRPDHLCTFCKTQHNLAAPVILNPTPSTLKALKAEWDKRQSNPEESGI